MKRVGYFKALTSEEQKIINLSVDHLYIETVSSGGENLLECIRNLEINDILVIKTLKDLAANLEDLIKVYEVLIKKNISLQVLGSYEMCTHDKNNGVRALMMKTSYSLLRELAGVTEEPVKEVEDKVDEVIQVPPRKAVKGAGRKKTPLSKEQIKEVKAWLRGDITMAECTRRTSISNPTLYRIRKEGRVE